MSGLLEERKLTFGAANNWNFGIYVLDMIDKTPQRVYTSVDIPGRNGSLMIDNKRFQNRTYEYRCIAYTGNGNARALLDTFIGYLASDSGYQRLTDSKWSDEYRMAIFRDCTNIEFDRANARFKFKLTFDCKPQRFLTSGGNTTQFTRSGTITNPTRFEAKPLLQVYGTGTVAINDVSITITACNEYTYIDCETMDAYKGAENCNANIQVPGEFPVLKRGSNSISLTGVTKCVITPRWWRL